MNAPATMPTSPVVLPSLDLSTLLDVANVERAIIASRTQDVSQAAERAAYRLQRLLDGFGLELLAQLVANAGPVPERVLHNLADAAKAAEDAARVAERAARDARLRRREIFSPVLTAANLQRKRVADELARIEQRIARAPAERAEARKRLKDAGLDDEQIAGLELPPTQRDLDALHQQAHQLRAQVAVLLKFMGDPRREVLGGLELSGWPVGTLPGERAAAALEGAA